MTDSTRNRLTLGAVLLFTLFVSLPCAGWGVLREGGVALGLAIVAFIWFGVSRTRTESIRPMNQRHMTVTELLTILGVSLVLYGISLPPVISGPHRRRSPLPPASGVVPQADEGSKGAVSAEN